MSLNVPRAQCACWGDWNTAAGGIARATAGRALKIMMRSMDFNLTFSRGGAMEGIEAGRDSSSFTTEQEVSEEHCGEMWDVTRRGMPEGCENEAPGSEGKPKEGPSVPGRAA